MLSNDYKITCIVGATGSGKSSVAQYLILDCIKRGVKVWSNMPFYGSNVLDFNDLNKFEFTKENEDGVLIIDEAGICINNRDWEKLDKNIIKFMKLHRHYRIDVYIFSQGEDIDISFRRLAQQWYKVIKLPILFNKFSALIPVKTDLVLENGRWSLKYQGDNNILSWKYIPIYKTWSYFDSFSKPDLPQKIFEKWDVKVNENYETFLDKLKKYIILVYNKISNFINKILFKKKLRERINKNIKDSFYFKG